MYSLAEYRYYTQLQANIVDIIVVFGVIGTISIQTLGAYHILIWFNSKVRK
jgi:hypothetical protein